MYTLLFIIYASIIAQKPQKINLRFLFLRKIKLSLRMAFYSAGFYYLSSLFSLFSLFSSELTGSSDVKRSKSLSAGLPSTIFALRASCAS